MVTTRDRGSMSVFVVGLVMSFVMATGLAVDGGRILAARISVADHAENAARAGAQQVTLLRLGWRVLDPTRAEAAAEEYLRSHGLSGAVSVGIDSVTVTVTMAKNMTLLRLAGVGAKTVSATRTARLVST